MKLRLKIVIMICIFSVIFPKMLKDRNNKEIEIIKKEYKSSSYSTTSIETDLTIPNQSCDSVINENYTYKLNEGVYSNITRIISLEASFDNIFNVKSKSKYYYNINSVKSKLLKLKLLKIV